MSIERNAPYWVNPDGQLEETHHGYGLYLYLSISVSVCMYTIYIYLYLSIYR